MDLEEVRKYTRSHTYNYLQIRGGEYRFFTDHVLCLESRAHFFFPHNLFRPPREPVLFLSPVLNQKSGAGPKIRRQQKRKRKALAGESVGEVRCAGRKSPPSRHPATISLPHHPSSHPTSQPTPHHPQSCAFYTLLTFIRSAT